jgi:hypothetical protein
VTVFKDFNTEFSYCLSNHIVLLHIAGKRAIMKKAITAILTLLMSYLVSGQQFSQDNSSQIEKEDESNTYQSEAISSLEILQALDFLNVNIFKFKKGYLSQSYKLFVMIDKYTNGKIERSDTLFRGSNTYHFFKRGKEHPFFDYIDQMKFFTSSNDESFTIQLNTYASSVRQSFTYDKTHKNQFYHWRRYIDNSWQIDKKTPLFIFASSWKDEKYGIERFCGANILKENDRATRELLSYSPQYFLISYILHK